MAISKLEKTILGIIGTFAAIGIVKTSCNQYYNSNKNEKPAYNQSKEINEYQNK